MADLNVALILRLHDRLTGPARATVRGISGVGRSMTGTMQASRALNTAVRITETRVGALTRPTQAATGSVAGFAQAMTETMRASTGLGAAVRSTEVRVGALTRPTRTAADALRALQDQNRRVRETAVLVSGAVAGESSTIQQMARAAREASSAGGGLAAMQRRIEATARAASTAMTGLATAGGRIGRGAGQFGQSAGRAAMTTGMTAGALIGATGVLMRPAMQFEDFLTRLTTTERSVAGGQRALEWVQNFARTTPYEVAEVTDAFVSLRAYGLDPVNGLLRSAGNASASMGRTLGQAVEAVADAVTGENERLKEFGITARRSGDQVTYFYQAADGSRRSVRAAADDRAAIQRAITGIWDERFAGGMERQSRALSGMLSNLGDAWTGFALRVMNRGGVFDWVKSRVGGLLGRFDRMAADGSLDRLAERFGRDLRRTLDQALALAERLWALARRVVGAVQPLADAVGGWPNLIAIGAGLRIFASGLGMVAGSGTMLLGLKDGFRSFGELLGFGRAENGQLRRTSAWLDGLRGRLADHVRAAGGWGAAFRGAVTGILGGLRLVSVALLTTPAGWAILAISAAIAAGAVLIIRNWSRISAFFGGVWRGLRRGLEPVWRELQAFGREIAPLLAPFAPMMAAAGAALRVVGDALQGAWNWLERLFNPAQATAGELRAAGDAGERFGTAIAGALRNLLAPLKVVRMGLQGLRELMERPVVRRFWEASRRVVGRVGAAARERETRQAGDRRVQDSFWSGLAAGLNPALQETRRLMTELAQTAADLWRPTERILLGIGSQVADLFAPAMSSLRDFGREAERVLAPVSRFFDRLNGPRRPARPAPVRPRAQGDSLDARMARSRSLGEQVGRFLGDAALGPVRSFTTVLRLIPPAMAAVASATSSAWSQVAGAITGAWNTVSSRLNSGMAWLAGLPARFAGYGRDLMQGLRRGILEGVEATVEAVRSAATRLAEAVRGVLGIRSPSRVFAAIGRDTVAGLTLGIAANDDAPVRRTASMAARVAAVAAGALALPAAAAATPQGEAGAARPTVVVTGEAPPRPPFTPGGGDGRRPHAPITIASLTIPVTVNAAPGADARTQGVQVGRSVAEALNAALFDLRGD